MAHLLLKASLSLLLALTLGGCGWYPNRQVAYLEREPGRATQDEVRQEFGPPMAERQAEGEGATWIYRYTGVSSPMLLDVTEYWCVEYVLTFDTEKILRHWVRQGCPKE